MLWNVNLGPPFASTKTFKCEDRLPTFKLHYKYYAEDEEEERYSDYNMIMIQAQFRP